MAKVKKVIKVKDGIQVSNNKKLIALDQKPGDNKPVDQTIEQLKQPSQPAFNQWNKKINVAGYGDIDYDDELSRFITGKMNSYSGDDNIRNQFQYITDLYGRGGVRKIDESGTGYGTGDASLENTKAASRKYRWGKSKDYDRQQAASQVNRWIQEYAQMKHDEKNKPAEKKDLSKYNLDLKARVGKSMGGFNADYWNSLSTDNRRAGIRAGLSSYFDDLDNATDIDNTTEEGKKLLKLRENRKQILDDFDAIKDINNDGKISADEMSTYVSKHGINPFELMSYVKPLTEKEKAAETSKQEAEKAKATTKAFENSLTEFRKQNNIPSYYEWTGARDNTADFSNRGNWRATINGQRVVGTHAKGFSDLIDSLKDQHYEEGYGIPFADFGDEAKMQQHIINLGRANSPFDEVQRIYDSYNANVDEYFKKHAKSVEGIENVRDKRGSELSAAIFGGGAIEQEVEPRYAGTFVKKYYVRNTDRNTKYTKPLIAYYIDKDNKAHREDELIGKKKLGGTIDFNKIKKFQYGGFVATGLSKEEQDKYDNMVKSTQESREASAKRAATTSEIFDDNYELTAADKADLAALGLDVAGLIAGFVPGGSTVSAATGLGSTLLGTGAQYARDGFSWGLVGDAVVSGAMDAASLVPGAGQFAKGMKIANWAKSSGKWLRRALELSGYAQAGSVLAKIATDGAGDVTAGEWQQLLGGIRGLQARGTKTLMKYGTESAMPNSTVVKTKDGKLIQVDADNATLQKAYTPEVHQAKQEISVKTKELDDAIKSGKTPDEIKKIQDELNIIKTTTEGKLTAAGLDAGSAKRIVDNDIITGVDSMQKPLNSWKVWRVDSWQSPFVKGVETADFSSVRRLKDKNQSLDPFERWGRAIAKKAGYTDNTTLIAKKDALPSKVEMDRLNADEKSLEALSEANLKARETDLAAAKTAKKELDTKKQGLKSAEDIANTKESEFTAKKTAYKPLAKDYAQAKKDLADLSKQHKDIDDLIKSKGNKGTVSENIKRKELKTKIDEISTKLSELDSKKKAAAIELSGAHVEKVKAKDELKKVTDEIDKAKLDLENLGKKIKGQNVAKKQHQEDLKNLRESKYSRENELKKELEKETLELMSNYKTSKSGRLASSGVGSYGAAGAAVGTAILGAGIANEISNLNKLDEIDKMSVDELDSSISILEKELNKTTDSKKRNRIKDELKYYKAARKEKNKVSKKANGGRLVLKAQEGLQLKFPTLQESFAQRNKATNPYSFESSFGTISYNPNTSAKVGVDPTFDQNVDQNIRQQKLKLALATGDPIIPKVFNIPGAAQKPQLVEYGNQTVTETLPEKIGTALNRVVNPTILKYFNTKNTNRKLMDKIKKMPRPTPAIAPTTTKLKNVGISSAMDQYGQIAAQENSIQPMYSDAKLNAAIRLATNSNANQVRNQIGQQIQAQNQQIDATNAQLYSQDAASRAQIAKANADELRQHNMMMNQYEQGLIRSEGQSRDNLLSEWKYKQDAQKDHMRTLELEDAYSNLKKTYDSDADAIDAIYTNKATAADSSSLSDYFTKNPAEKAKYQKEIQAKRDLFNKNWRTEQKRIYRNYQTGLFKSGGTIEEKMALERQKAELKRVLERDKAFNKLMIEKMKAHEKVLSSLMKKK